MPAPRKPTSRAASRTSSPHARAVATPTRRSHEERRVEIVDAALRLIASRGIASLTVAALASELGLTGGALYRHFPSTDAILDAVSERSVALLDASLPESTLAPLLWLERFVESRTRTVAGYRGLASLILSEQLAMALPEQALDRLRGAVRRTFKAVEQAILAAQERGEVRRDLAARDLTPIVMGIVQMTALSQAGALISRVATADRAWPTLRTLLQSQATAQSPVQK